MASLWDFSRSDTPSPTLEEISSNFFNTLREQSGEGVVTRRQAKQLALDEAVNPVESSSNEQTSRNEELGHKTSASEAAIAHSEPPSPALSLPSDSSLVDNLNEEKNDGNLSAAPFLDETLVAENSDLKAYIYKSHFRRLKNFT